MSSQTHYPDLELLSAYIDGELTDTERIALEQRLQSEPDLQRELDELRVIVEAVRTLPPVTAPYNFTLTPEMVGIVEQEQIQPQPEPARLLMFVTSAAFTVMSAAAAMLLVAFGFVALLSSSSNDMAMSAPVSLQANDQVAQGIAAVPTLTPLSAAQSAGIPLTAIAPEDVQDNEQAASSNYNGIPLEPRLFVPATEDTFTQDGAGLGSALGDGGDGAASSMAEPGTGAELDDAQNTIPADESGESRDDNADSGTFAGPTTSTSAEEVIEEVEEAEPPPAIVGQTEMYSAESPQPFAGGGNVIADDALEFEVPDGEGFRSFDDDFAEQSAPQASSGDLALQAPQAQANTDGTLEREDITGVDAAETNSDDPNAVGDLADTTAESDMDDALLESQTTTIIEPTEIAQVTENGRNQSDEPSQILGGEENQIMDKRSRQPAVVIDQSVIALVSIVAGVMILLTIIVLQIARRRLHGGS